MTYFPVEIAIMLGILVALVSAWIVLLLVEADNE